MLPFALTKLGSNLTHTVYVGEDVQWPWSNFLDPSPRSKKLFMDNPFQSMVLSGSNLYPSKDCMCTSLYTMLDLVRLKQWNLEYFPLVFIHFWCLEHFFSQNISLHQIILSSSINLMHSNKLDQEIKISGNQNNTW